MPKQFLSMEFNSIDQFLDTLEGSVESSGSFSLNLDAARQKLKGFQLPDPGLYPLFLVAAAVASEARRFDVWTDEKELRFEFDGSPFLLTELEQLEGYLFASDEVPARLQNLAIALSATGELAPSFELRSATARLVCSDGDYQTSKAEHASKTQLIVPRPKESFLSRFKDRAPNLQEVMSVSRFAPLSIRFNNGFPSWGWSFRSPVVHRTLKSKQRMGYPPTAYDCHKQEVDSPGSFGGVIALVREEKARDLLVVVHGISHPVPIDAPHMEGVLWHDGLTRDLSCTQLVQDQKMKQFLDQLKGQIADMVLQRVTSQEAFRAYDRQMLEPLAESSEAHFREAGDEDSAERLHQWIVADDSEEPEVLSDEGYESFRAQWTVIAESPKGMALRARALELFLGEKRRLANNYNWQDLETLVERMRPLFSPPKLELESLAQVLKALNGRKEMTFDKGEMKGEDHWQEGLLSLLTGDWESAEKSLQAAAKSLPKEANVVLAHAYLGRNDPRLALQAAERALESAASTERYLQGQPGKASEMQRYVEANAVYRDLVADCLIASGRPLEALDMKIEALPQKPKDHKLHALRIEDIHRMGRGQWPFLTSVKWRLKALSAGWKAEEKDIPYYCPQRFRKRLEEHWAQLEAYLDHRPQRLDIETLFDPRFSTFERTRYYLDRVARELRLRGEPRVADRLVARQALMQRAKRLCDRIVFGAKQG